MAAAEVELIRPDWPVPAHVRAVSTTRVGGFSVGRYASLNLGSHVDDDPLAVERNRTILGHVLDLPAVPSWLEQVHGAHVVDAAAAAPSGGITGDASFTCAVGVICAILTADCLPVLLTDRDGRFVAAAHGGWRGLVGGVLENTVAAFAAHGVAGKDMVAWLGPAIAPAAYEVDAMVTDALREGDEAALTRADSTHWRLDLYTLARLRLAACGVTAVFGGDCCTFAAADRFFSYRRDGVCGRQATLIWLE